MYYKVIKNNKVIDVLDKLTFLKYQEKHNRMILCKESEAQAFFSSDRKKIWHTETMYNHPGKDYETVELVSIDEYEYKQLKMLNLSTPQEIIDAFLLGLIEEGII